MPEMEVVGVSTPASPDLSLALARLDPDDRALIAMRYLAGLRSEEIAVATGRTSVAVRARLSRLMARLRKDLTDD